MKSRDVFLHWLKWPRPCIIEVFFSPPFPIVFMWLSSSVLVQNPSTLCFGEAQKHFFHNHDWEQSLKSHGDQGEISVSVWVQTFSILFWCGSMQHSGGEGRCQLCDLYWQPEWDVLLLGLRGLCCTICKSGKESQRILESFELYPPLWVCLSLKSVCFHNYVK